MKKLLLLAIFCGFVVAGTIGCGGEPTKAGAAATGAAPPAGGTGAKPK
jgi:hypothetical protein